MTITDNHRNPKILWPIDAFQCDKKMSANIYTALKRTFGTKIPVVQPVYILTPNATVTPISWFEELIPKIRVDAQARLDSLLTYCPFPVARAKILVESSKNMQCAIDKLNQFANRTAANLILIPTQAKSGLKRFVLGSFAESMLIYAKVPLLTISPKLKEQIKRKRQCLVPVDLESSDYMEVVDRIIDELKGQSIELLFFHTMLPNLNTTPWPDSSLLFDSRDLVTSRLTEEQEHRRKLGDKLVKKAQAKGCESRNVMSLTLLSAEDSIVETAEKRIVDFIAMASHSSRFSFLFAGSVTRHVIRHAHCPVWALPLPARKRSR